MTRKVVLLVVSILMTTIIITMVLFQLLVYTFEPMRIQNNEYTFYI